MLFAVREFQITDLDQIVTLIYDTVHAINAQDYTLEQLAAWAPILLADERRERTPRLEESLSQNISYVSIRDKTIGGFADITEDGYLDHLYVHKYFQGQGIACGLLHRVEQEVLRHGVKQIRANVSITAKPFFEQKGYVAVRPQTVWVRGVSMVNFKMTKRF